MSDDMEAALRQFADWIRSNQQHLGPEFEKVLYDNLWELYVREGPPRRAMVGLFASLTDEQKMRALDYRGEEG